MGQSFSSQENDNIDDSWTEINDDTIKPIKKIAFKILGMRLNMRKM